MRPGFIPDFSEGTSHYSAVPMLWHPGTAEDRRFLGMKTGYIKVDKEKIKVVVAYCCTECGVLKLYAE